MAKKKQGKRGRPKGFKMPEKLQLMITLSPSARDMLDKLCEETGLLKSQVIELLIRKNYKSKADIIMDLL